MSNLVRLRARTSRELAQYVLRQVGVVFPGIEDTDDESLIVAGTIEAIERLRPILSSVRTYEANYFDHFNSLQYSTFLYLLGNSIWRIRGACELCDRLFLLNKMLSSVELFYTLDLPEVFFISHGVGTVLGGAQYGSPLVFFQGVTVGRVGNDRPAIGGGVVLYPGSSVTGRSAIGKRAVIGAGVLLHNAVVPDDVVVRLHGAQQVIAPRKKDYLGLYLR
jgi:serine O-acetyltransferase